MIGLIKTFLRKCDAKEMPINHSVFNWKISKKTELHPDKHELKHPKKSTPKKIQI